MERYVLGHEGEGDTKTVVECELTIYVAMKRMAASNVLVVGLQGLGVEIGTMITSMYARTFDLTTGTRSEKPRVSRRKICHHI